MSEAPKGGELFIVDNSDEAWKGLKYLQEWTQIASAFDIATGYSAYSPDLPGCVAAGKARDSVEREMHDAIEFHLDGLRRAGEPIPAPRSQASYCEVGA